MTIVFERWLVVIYHFPSSKFDKVEKNKVNFPFTSVLELILNVFPEGLVKVADTGEFGLPAPETSIISPL